MFQEKILTFARRVIASFQQSRNKVRIRKSTRYGLSIFAFNDRVNLEREVAEQVRKQSLGLH